MAMNKYGGINDMPDGFTKTELGKRVYNLWFGMLRRCYDVKQHERTRGKSYSNVIVCERWFYLKNFYEDIQKLDGYTDWLEKDSMSLDKDLFAQEVTKIYSPQTCSFIPIADNIREMNERQRPYEQLHEKKKVYYVAFKGEEYHVFNSESEACEKLGVARCSVASAWHQKTKIKGYTIIRVGAKMVEPQESEG